MSAAFFGVPLFQCLFPKKEQQAVGACGEADFLNVQKTIQAVNPIDIQPPRRCVSLCPSVIITLF